MKRRWRASDTRDRREGSEKTIQDLFPRLCRSGRIEDCRLTRMRKSKVSGFPPDRGVAQQGRRMGAPHFLGSTEPFCMRRGSYLVRRICNGSLEPLQSFDPVTTNI